MPYIGRAPQVGNYSKLDTIAASFNGSTTTFNLTISGSAFTASLPTQMLISIDGVIQEPTTAYTVSGSTITFTGPPANGATFFGLVLGDSLDIGTPSDGTVTGAKLTSGAVTAGKIGTGGVSANTQLAAGVVTAHSFGNGEIETKIPTLAKTGAVQVFSVAQRGSVTDAGSLIANTTFRQDFAASNFFKMTLAGNVTINNPTNQVAGQSGAIEIVNGGSHTVSFGSDFKFASGTAPTITASGTDVLSYYVKSANNIVIDALQAIS